MTEKLIAVRDGALLVRGEGDGVAFPTRAELEAAGVDVSAAHDLRTGATMKAIAVDRDVPGYSVRGVRSLFGVLPPEDLAAIGSAMHVVRWAETSRFCSRCATPTERVPDERAMKCPKCELALYPRISPAIIVLVRRGEEARQGGVLRQREDTAVDEKRFGLVDRLELAISRETAIVEPLLAKLRYRGHERGPWSSRGTALSVKACTPPPAR